MFASGTDPAVGSSALLGGMVRMQDRAPVTSDANFDQCWSGIQTVEFTLVSPWLCQSQTVNSSNSDPDARRLMAIGGEVPLPQRLPSPMYSFSRPKTQGCQTRSGNAQRQR